MASLTDMNSKIIELNGMELQRLRGSYQKTQFQNWNLAQSNSQMLAVWKILCLVLIVAKFCVTSRGV